MNILRWDGYDQLGLEVVLVGVGAAVTASVLPALARAVRDDAIEFPAVLPQAMAPAGVRPPVTGTLMLDDPSWSQHLLHLAPHLLVVALVLLGVVQLFGVAGSARRGEPFERANVRRLLVVATALIVGGPVLAFLDAVARAELVQAVLPHARVFSMTFTFAPVLAGLLAAFFAEILARGARLRDEVEGLV